MICSNKATQAATMKTLETDSETLRRTSASVPIAKDLSPSEPLYNNGEDMMSRVHERVHEREY